MKALRSSFVVAMFLSLWLPADREAPAQSLPRSDQRAGPPKDTNTKRAFPAIQSRAEWEARAHSIRHNLLVSCGLWPLPEKTPLNAQVFGRVERDGYSIEKVYFQTYPGFYLAGNLYRPLGQGRGPFPAILNPHGHWSNGRMADTKDGSIAARCINFAKQGMIAFSYDMVGYNDTTQVKHNFASHPTNQLWGVSLMGLQTWNSIRALDFLESLPDADKTRLACTGESGGGTQTFMLGAVDDRLAVQAPIVMVSHSMQGGCLCENAPGLRVEYNNMELAAVPAPRPQILVAAAGDWTKDTLSAEGPAIESVYRLFNAVEKLRYVRFDFDHNYNQTSREAVYAWFGRWLLRQPDAPSRDEQAYVKEPDQELRVFPDGKLPADALNEEQLIAWLIRSRQTQLEALKPRDPRSLEQFKKLMKPTWQHVLQVEFPEQGLLVEVGESKKVGTCSLNPLLLGRAGQGDRVPALHITPEKQSSKAIVVLAHPEGKSAFLDPAGAPAGLAKKLLERGQAVALLDTFLTGELANAEAQKARKPFQNFFTTYNRTDAQERVQDLLTACAFAQNHSKGRRVVLCGVGRAGLWALLAAPAADAVVADCDALDPANDEAMLAQDLFVPDIRTLGAFAGTATLAAPHPLLLHNAAEASSTTWLRDVYRTLRQSKSLRLEPTRLPDDAVADWILKL